MLYVMVPHRLRPVKFNTKVRFFKHPFSAPDGELEGLILFLCQIVIQDQYHAKLIKDGDTVVDAGANMGVFSVLAAQNPAVTVWAFEPTPSTFELLKENTKYYPNIRCCNYALGEANKQSSILLRVGSGTNCIGEGGIPVLMRTIDSFNITMDFLKIDTEGYEANILKGAAETIKKCKPIIAMSAYHNPEDKAELPKLLNSIAPYDCELYYDCEEDFICKPK